MERHNYSVYSVDKMKIGTFTLRMLKDFGKVIVHFESDKAHRPFVKMKAINLPATGFTMTIENSEINKRRLILDEINNFFGSRRTMEIV
jgi:hypothetical protein